jgi:2-polyprenyl-3-methyl-5-hydroxy-6-metoxy-1,4-benzoquinol methylase
VGLAKAAQRAKEAGVQVDFQQVDMDEYRFTAQFDLIIKCTFLLRELIPEAVQALNPGGLLIIDTIMESEELLASHTPAYLLRRGELQRICEGFDGEILFYEELLEGEFPTARVMFRKSG